MTPPNPLRILHVGNMLLDKPIARLRSDRVEHRREEMREVFFRLMNLIEQQQVSLVLITGNLFDLDYLTNDTVSFLVRCFREHHDTVFVIAPGPSDPFSETSVYRSGRFPQNVHILNEEVLSEIDLPDLGVTVYGWAFLGKEHRFSPIKNRHVRSLARFNILMGYGVSEEISDSLCPVEREDVAAFGAHYAALSGRGVFEGFERVGSSLVAYSGKPECTSFSDVQAGGVNLIQAVPHEDGAWQIAAKRVETGSYRYAEEVLDISHLSVNEDVIARILARIAEAGYDEKTALRVCLRGTVPLETAYYLLETAADYGVYAIEILDETVPTDGTEFLLREMSARGELYRHLYPAMTEGTPESRARAAGVFRLGYAALMGKDTLKI